MTQKKPQLTREWLQEEYVTKGRSVVDIGQEVGYHPSSIARCLQRHGIPTRKNRRRTINHKGQVFGRLTVLEQVQIGGNVAKWLCRCDCGKETVVVGFALRNGLTVSCGCYRRDIGFEGYGELSKSYWASVLRCAESRGLDVEVTIQQAWELFLSQDGRCALTGQPIHIERNIGRKRCLHTASFDRKDSSRGYTIDNVQWVHRDVNRLKNHFPEEYLLAIARQLLEHKGFTVLPPDNPKQHQESSHALVA